MMELNSMLTGAIVMASLTVSLFFLRFWKSTRDRFFLYFAISFAIQAVSRGVLYVTSSLQNEGAPAYYLARLAAYILILVAIIEKNRHRDK